jgi:hypothetical protein
MPRAAPQAVDFFGLSRHARQPNCMMFHAEAATSNEVPESFADYICNHKSFG